LFWDERKNTCWGGKGRETSFQGKIGRITTREEGARGLLVQKTPLIGRGPTGNTKRERERPTRTEGWSGIKGKTKRKTPSGLGCQ